MRDSLFLWAFNVLCQATCISTAGLAVAATVRKHASAKYWVLSSALFLLLLTPIIAAVVQGCGRSFVYFEVCTRVPSKVIARAEALAPILPPSMGLNSRGDESDTPLTFIESGGDVAAKAVTVFNDAELHRPSDVEPSPRPAVPLRLTSNVAMPTAFAGNESHRNVVHESELPPAWRRWAGLLVGAWFTGAMFFLVRIGVSFWRLRGIVRRAVPTGNLVAVEVFASVVRDLQPKRIPELGLSDEVSGPISAGWFSPRIVLPTRLAHQVSVVQLRDVFVHEMAHVLRRDPLAVLLQNLARALYWFHPLALWLNRALAQAREEICDNYVLTATSAASYSRTLLTLAELVSSRPIPGAVGLFTSGWRLEHRVAGLLDEHRSHAVGLRGSARLLVAAMSLLVAVGVALGTVSISTSPEASSVAVSNLATSAGPRSDWTEPAKAGALRDGPTLRGSGQNREMLLRGRVLGMNGKPAHGFELVASAYSQQLHREVLPTHIAGSDFEIWVPIGRSDWFHTQLTATAPNGKTCAARGIEHYKLRTAALEGIELRLASTRAVEISVTHVGVPVAGTHVKLELSGMRLPQKMTDANGKAVFQLVEGEKLNRLTAWTDDFRIGGYSFLRKPWRDPAGDAFTVELHDCRDQTFRLLDAADNSPVPNVPIDLVIGTGTPDFNYPVSPVTFPHSRLATDAKGEATCRWFPDWDVHGAYVEIRDARWAAAAVHGNFRTGDDGALVMTLKRRVDRKPFVGKVTSERLDVRGLLVEIKSHQGEEVLRSDNVYAFTDNAGNFTAHVIPGARYSVCVNDARLLSPMIDLVPYESKSVNASIPTLEVSEASPVEIHLTTGPRAEPIRNERINLRQSHRYNWLVRGQKRGGLAARDQTVFTGDDGVARGHALAGTEVGVSVNAGEWRALRHVAVKDGSATLVHIHREIDAQREVQARLFAPPGVDVDLAGAEVICGSIDGETRERQVMTTDVEGRFRFTTKAIQLGVFASTADGQAAGVVKTANVGGPIEIHLKPAIDLHGRLLGENDEPLTGHSVRVTPRVGGERDFEKPFATSFETKTFETKTDADGNYTLKDLPAELAMMLQADSIDGWRFDVYLDKFFLATGEKRPTMVSRLLSRSRTSDDRLLSERHDRVLRNAGLGGFHVLVLSYGSSLEGFVSMHVLDRESKGDVATFLELHITDAAKMNRADRKFAESNDWLLPAPGRVFACVLNESGIELGRTTFAVDNINVAAEATAFLRKFAPPQADAKAKWEAALADAKRTGRRVWAQIGPRYREQSFRLSRWLDDNRELLEQDYVSLKIDDVRDKHGAEVVSRITNNRGESGFPFHAIIDANGQALIDSDSRVGNIGDNPATFEGRRHLTKMLSQTSTHLTPREIKLLVQTLEHDGR